MSTDPQRRFAEIPEEQMLLINQLCNQFEADWQQGVRPAVEETLAKIEPQFHSPALEELLALEFEYRRRLGMRIEIAEYAKRFPDVAPDWLANLLAAVNRNAAQQPAKSSGQPTKLGDYKILGCLGSGGMGTVYKAIHERMGRLVALKVLHPKIQSNPQLLKRFDREIRAAARLTHPNIVAALDAREQDGIHFLIMEFVDGTDLEATVLREGPFSVPVAVDCVTQAARALKYAHQQGVIHRDIKPANLLRDVEGTVKVLDMGLARMINRDSAASDLTKSGMVMGTAAFMPPEQARDSRRADARSDIYSLGCTLYFLLTGRPIYAADTPIATFAAHVDQPIPSLTAANGAITSELDTVFCRMVQKDPQQRYQTAAEVVNALASLPSEQVAERHPAKHADVVEASPNAPTDILVDDVKLSAGQDKQMSRVDSRRASRKNKRRKLLAAVAIAAVFGCIAFFIINGQDGDVSAEKPYALEFNGISSFVSVPELEPEAGATYTLDVIVQPREFRTSNVITWLGPHWMAVFVSNGRWGLARRFAGNSYVVMAKEEAVLDEVVHLAGVFVGSDLRLFINGNPADLDHLEYPLSETNGGLFIGGVAPGRLPGEQNDRFFNGLVHSVRISRGVRYAESFVPPTILDADEDVIAVFPLNEGSGTQTRDAGKAAWEGSLIDAKWRSTKESN